MPASSKQPSYQIWLLGLTLLGCGGQHPGSQQDAATTRLDAGPDAPSPPAGVLPAGLLGTWNVTTATFTPDGGQAQSNPALIGKPINLTSAGTYTFNGGSGSWSVVDIVPADWNRWAVGPYTEVRKVVIVPADGQVVDGPLRESGTSIFGFQTIYRPTTGPAGRVEMEFGRSKR
jgi:hypothetical protein